MNLHRKYIRLALEEAQAAFAAGEAPVGAVVVSGDTIIGRGRNRMEELADPAAHAEMEAMAQAREKLGGKHLSETVLYCTLEPCPMCAGAAALRRVKMIVYGAPDLRWGACGTLFNIVDDNRLNHRIEVIGGVMEEECAGILQEFFKDRRV